MCAKNRHETKPTEKNRTEMKKKRKQGVQTEGGKKTKYTASKQEADRNVEKIEDQLEGLQGILCKTRGKFQRS